MNSEHTKQDATTRPRRALNSLPYAEVAAFRQANSLSSLAPSGQRVTTVHDRLRHYPSPDLRPTAGGEGDHQSKRPADSHTGRATSHNTRRIPDEP